MSTSHACLRQIIAALPGCLSEILTVFRCRDAQLFLSTQRGATSSSQRSHPQGMASPDRHVCCKLIRCRGCSRCSKACSIIRKYSFQRQDVPAGPKFLSTTYACGPPLCTRIIITTDHGLRQDGRGMRKCSSSDTWALEAYEMVCTSF